jgi:hypothetical protein
MENISTISPRLEPDQVGDQFFFHLKSPDGTRIFTSPFFQESTQRDQALRQLGNKDQHRLLLKTDGPFSFTYLSTDQKELGSSISFEDHQKMTEALDWVESALHQIDVPEEVSSQQADHPPRYAFQLTFYPKDDGWTGRIEYPFGQDRSSFEGVDMASIHAFLRKHLPFSHPQGMKSEGSTHQNPPNPLRRQKQVPPGVRLFQPPEKKIRVEILQEGEPAPSALDRNSPNLSIQVKGFKPPVDTSPTSQVTAFVHAQSLNENQIIQIGYFNGNIEAQALQIPIQLSGLSRGLHRVGVEVNTRKDVSPDETIKGSTLLQVY